MATSIGPKIGVDGEAEYRAQMDRLITKTKALKAEEEALKTAVHELRHIRRGEMYDRNYIEYS